MLAFFLASLSELAPSSNHGQRSYKDDREVALAVNSLVELNSELISPRQRVLESRNLPL